jgi:hypothetical protein
MMDQKSNSLLTFALNYFCVSIFGTALLLFDIWPKPPSAPVEWLLLFLMVVPVVSTGEWLSGGVLRNALLDVIGSETQPLPMRCWRVFYYSVMCILFSTTTVAIVEWIRRL